MSTPRHGCWLSMALVVCLCFMGTAAAQDFIDRVLVVIDNVPLTLSEYRVRHRQEVVDSGRLAPFDGEVNPVLLERIVEERIQVARADARGIEVSEQEIDTAIEFIARQNGISSAELLNRLNADGFSQLDFRESIRNQQKIRKLVDVVANSRVNVSDQEIDNYLNAHDELKAGDESYEVSHLLVQISNKSPGQVQSERENIELIRQRILEGLAFDSAVRDFSDSANRDEGGYLGWRTPEQLPELFLDELQGMDPASKPISAVLESENGLHLLKLHDRKGSGALVDQQQIQHILVAPDGQTTLPEAEQQANEIYDRLISGESFEKMARLYSDDAQSRTRGGSLGWVNPGTLVPAFEEVAASMTLGEISEPVRTRFGFHIIRVNDRRSTDMASEVAVNRARQAIFRRKAEEIYSSWLQSIRERTFIEYVGMPEPEEN